MANDVGAFKKQHAKATHEVELASFLNMRDAIAKLEKVTSSLVRA